MYLSLSYHSTLSCCAIHITGISANIPNNTIRAAIPNS